MRIIQITDLHVAVDEHPYNINVRKNLQDVLLSVYSNPPDYLVVTGDLCYRDGQVPIYKWVYDQLEGTNIPYEIIAGNHDDPVMMAETFDLKQHLKDGKYYYAKKLGHHLCLFLDSSDRTLGEDQFRWLRRQLKNATGNILLFMHHPPVHAGVPFMDNRHDFQDREALQEVLFSYPHPIALFCGHYHVDKIIQLKNVLIHITPSLFFQIDSSEPDFKVDHHRIAYREIELEDLSLRTTLRYLDGNKLED